MFGILRFLYQSITNTFPLFKHSTPSKALRRSKLTISRSAKWKDQSIYILQHHLEEFVASQVFPRLEGEYNAKVYFPPRDDTPGKDIFSNTRDAIHQSNVVFLFITKDFLKHPWFGYATELVISKGFHSVFIALEKGVSYDGLPLHVGWLLRLCNGFVPFSKEEPLELDAFYKICSSQLSDAGLKSEFLEENCAMQCEQLLTSENDTSSRKHDICVIHPDDGTTHVQDFVTDFEEKSGLSVFCSERDIIPGKYISKHLVSKMYGSRMTVLILNSIDDQERMTFLMSIALSRTTVPCAVYYDPRIFPDIAKRIHSDCHKIIPITVNCDLGKIISSSFSL